MQEEVKRKRYCWEDRGNLYLVEHRGGRSGKDREKTGTGRADGSTLSRGERAGMIAYYMDGEKLGELPVVTAEAVEKAGYIDQLQKLFGKWAGFRNKAA